MTEQTQSFNGEDRVNPPLRGDEVSRLRGFLDYQRDTFRWKCAGLTREQLAQPPPPSDMTLGGMMKHLAIVDQSWFEVDYAGGQMMPPFDTVDWDADRDWEWHTSNDDSPEALRRLFDEAVRRSDAVLDAAVAPEAGLDSESAATGPRAATAGSACATSCCT